MSSPGTTWPAVLGELIAGQDISGESAGWAMRQILAGEATPAQLAAFVVALRAKGETVEELSALADTMLEFATPIEITRACRRRRRLGRRPGQHGQHLDHGRDRGGRRRRPGRQARQPGRLVGLRGRRCAGGAWVSCSTCPRSSRCAVVDQVGIGFLFAPLYHPGAAPRRAGPRPARDPDHVQLPRAAGQPGPTARPGGRRGRCPDGRADGRGAGRPRQPGAWCSMAVDGLDELTTTTASQVWLYRRRRGPDARAGAGRAGHRARAGRRSWSVGMRT